MLRLTQTALSSPTGWTVMRLTPVTNLCVVGSPRLGQRALQSVSSPVTYKRTISSSKAISKPMCTSQDEKKAFFISTSNSLLGLAAQYHALGSPEVANYLAKQSLDIATKHGMDISMHEATKWLSCSSHPTADSQCVNNQSAEEEMSQLSLQMQQLAYMSFQLGDFHLAKHTSEQALTISERLLGVRHPMVKQCNETMEDIGFMIMEKQIEQEWNTKLANVN